MCNHAVDTQAVIQHLQEHIYPTIDEKIRLALESDFLGDISLPENAFLVYLLQDIQTDFHSLVIYEQKLVFPSILKVFDAKKTTSSLPDLNDLLYLTKSKEHKLLQHIEKLNVRLMSIPLLESLINQYALVKVFQEEFIPAKTQWNIMIQDRLHSCQCFRSLAQTKKNNPFFTNTPD